MRVTILDYGVGNVRSIANAFAAIGATPRLEADLRTALGAERLVLPGVGAFDAAARRLAPGRVELRDRVEGGLHLLGICLGMQLLFDSSAEGALEGSGLIAGRVTRVDAPRLPQLGWNTLAGASEPAIAAAGLGSAYFANSFACRPRDPGVVTSWVSHGRDRFAASVRARRVVGVQFHPEKSSAAGLRFLRAWLEGSAA